MKRFYQTASLQEAMTGFQVVLDQRAVARTQRLPVIAVHVGHVEIIAKASPDLVEHHDPLGGRRALYDHAPLSDAVRA